MPRLTQRSVAAFTLLELMTVITVILILAAMIVGVFAGMRERADVAACSTNLQSLYAAAAAYLQQNGQWPQISTSTLKTQGDTQYASAWIAAFRPYGVGPNNWLCPSIQRDLGNPDVSQPANIRIDYFATPFDGRPGTPFLWPHQPWFIERGAPHQGGNLMIWTNGQILNLTQALQFQQ
jgi:type II secretory pathway pseudopilin PulG